MDERLDAFRTRHFDGDGIPQPYGGLDRRIQARHVFFPDNSPFDKSPHTRAYARMNNQ
jgi:hypothetical protein